MSNGELNELLNKEENAEDYIIVVTNLIGKDQNRIGQSLFDLISNPFLH